MNYKDIISNVNVYGIQESIVASGYPMLTEPYNHSEFINACKDVVVNGEDSSHIKRSRKLANTNVGEGHDNYLNGIIVQFDLKFTVKAWTEAERYHFFDFVSSMSSMHRLPKMDLDTVFCSYITENIKNRRAYGDSSLMLSTLVLSNENRLLIMRGSPTSTGGGGCHLWTEKNA